MYITYREAVVSDAAKILEYLKIVGGESNNLTFGSEGIPFSVEQEELHLNRIAQSECSRIFLAFDGDRIVGNASVNGSTKPRLFHRRSLAISVLREYWGCHIGTGLMERMISFACETGAELLYLEVRSDNERAKALYRKFGFRSFGIFPKYFKINGEYIDVDCMTLELI